MSSQNLISFSPVVNKSYEIAFLFSVTASESENGVFCLCCVLFNSSEHAFVKNSINDWANLGTLIKRHLDQPGHSKAPFGSTNICQRKNKRRWNIPFIFQQKQLLLVVNV
jgi:hypothetical protein